MNDKYIPSAKVRQYSDLDLNFTAHPITGDVVKLINEKAIIGALKNLVFLNYYEKPFHPDIGTGIYGSLFELYPDQAELEVLKGKMMSILAIYEPRAETIGITFERPDSQPNALYVEVYFTPINSIEPISFNFFLTPVR